MTWKNVYVSQLINDLTDPWKQMFHSEGIQPHTCNILIGTEPSDITRASLLKITDYLANFVEPENFLCSRVSTVLRKMQVVPMDEDTIILRLYYNGAKARILTLQLSLDKGILQLH